MNRDSVSRLRLDRRLLYRRGWISPEERERALEALPDVSHKAITLGAAGGESNDEAEGSETPERA